MQSVYVNESSESHELRVLDVVRQVQAQAESVKEPSVEEIKVIVRVAALVLSRIDEHLDNDGAGAGRAPRARASSGSGSCSRRGRRESHDEARGQAAASPTRTSGEPPSVSRVASTRCGRGTISCRTRTSIECAAACSYLGDALYELREALDLLNGELPVEDEVREREV